MNGRPEHDYEETSELQEQEEQSFSHRTRSNNNRNSFTANHNHTRNNLSLTNTISQGMQWLVESSIYITSTCIVWMLHATSYVLTRLPEDWEKLQHKVKHMLHIVCKWSLRSLVVYMGLCAAALVYMMLLCVCLCVALLTTSQFRRYRFSHVDGSRILPVPFNSLPLITEWWRQEPIDKSIAEYLYKSEQYHVDQYHAEHLPSPHLHSSRSKYLSEEEEELQEKERQVEHLSEHDRNYYQKEQEQQEKWSALQNEHEQEEEIQERKKMRSPEHRLAKRRPYSVPHDTYRDTNTRPNAFSLIAHHAKDIKLSLLQQYTESLLATATLILPSHSTSEDIFLPDGQINTRALFASGPPLFNAWGEYSAEVQLIFSKSSVPVERDVSIVLESSMLFVDEETSGLLSSTLESNRQTNNNNMNVLFSTTHTAPLHLTPVNEEFHKRRLSQFYSFCVVRWIQECLHLCKRALRLCFIVPIKTYEAFHRYLRQSSQMVFPLFDESKEMALTLPVYEHFTPPISLQSRLRAMNFTCYYVVHEETELNELWQTSPNIKHYHQHTNKNSNEMRFTSPLQLRRILLHSSLRLHGLARFFMMYPIFSFIVCTIVCFATCVAVMNVILAGLGLFVYVKLIRKGQSHKQEHKGKKNKKKNRSSKLYKNTWNRNDNSDSDKYNYSSTDNSSSSNSSTNNNNDDSSWSNVIWTGNNDDSFSPSDSVSNNNNDINNKKKKTKQHKKNQKKNKQIARFLLSHTDSFPQATSYNELSRPSSSSSSSSSANSTSSSSESETETSKATLIPVDDTSLSIGQHTSDNNKHIDKHKNTNDSSHVRTNDEKLQESRQEHEQEQEEQNEEKKKEENAETQSTFLSAKELTTPLSPPPSSSPFYTNAKLSEEHEKEKKLESEPHKTQETKTNDASSTTSRHSAIVKEVKDKEDDKKEANSVKVEGNTNKDNKDHSSDSRGDSESSSSSNENMYDKVRWNATNRQEAT